MKSGSYECTIGYFQRHVLRMLETEIFVSCFSSRLARIVERNIDMETCRFTHHFDFHFVLSAFRNKVPDDYLGLIFRISLPKNALK